MKEVRLRHRWEDKLNVRSGKIVIASTVFTAVMIAGFSYWALRAPLAGATTAPGVISASGRNVQIQHLEGGVVQKILVREGDRVSEGQPLVTLDDTSARTQLNRLTGQFYFLQAQTQRLQAERDGLPSLAIDIQPSKYVSADFINNLVTEQSKEFDARYARFQSETDILHQRVRTLNAALGGLQAQQEAIRQQVNIVDEEAATKHSLLEKGLTSRSEYTQLLRIKAELLGQAGAIEAELATNGTQLGEANEQIERLRTQRVEQAVTSLNEIRSTLADIEQQAEAAQAVLKRTHILSPVDGIVVTSTYNAIGSVLSPGEKVIEILPTSSGLLVEAKIRPEDIDSLHSGQKARLRMSALDAGLTPEIPATLINVSADRLVEEETHQPYYRAELKIGSRLPAGVVLEQLLPGMPVEVFIETGSRTFAEYIFRPLTDSFSRSLIEK